MNHAQTGNLLKNLGQQNTIRLLRKEFYCCGDIATTAVMGFQIQDTERRIVFPKALQQHGTEVHHEERQVGRIGYSHLLHIHKIVQPPVWLSIPKVEFDRKTQGIGLPDLFIG